MKLVSALLLSFVALAQAAPPILDLSRFKLTFSDEFDGEPTLHDEDKPSIIGGSDDAV